MLHTYSSITAQSQQMHTSTSTHDPCNTFSWPSQHLNSARSIQKHKKHYTINPNKFTISCKNHYTGLQTTEWTIQVKLIHLQIKSNHSKSNLKLRISSRNWSQKVDCESKLMQQCKCNPTNLQDRIYSDFELKCDLTYCTCRKNHQHSISQLLRSELRSQSKATTTSNDKNAGGISRARIYLVKVWLLLVSIFFNNTVAKKNSNLRTA